ncbi:hypothetical protein EYF80_021756 [Liparis tanakae]|uniref:Uncharacterized protein n=1 Tax=Liparis tanakae TaxID=230148 RepID=A0A4Z2HSI2_9TELE|nr:hypothetical protein EYF80_021756 [Liparis tanakae]
MPESQTESLLTESATVQIDRLTNSAAPGATSFASRQNCCGGFLWLSEKTANVFDMTLTNVQVNGVGRLEADGGVCFTSVDQSRQTDSRLETLLRSTLSVPPPILSSGPSVPHCPDCGHTLSTRAGSGSSWLRATAPGVHAQLWCRHAAMWDERQKNMPF